MSFLSLLIILVTRLQSKIQALALSDRIIGVTPPEPLADFSEVIQIGLDKIWRFSLKMYGEIGYRGKYQHVS